MPRPRKPARPFRYFNASLEAIRLVAIKHVRFPLSLRNVEDLLFERGIDLCHETVRMWWNRSGPMFAGHPLLADQSDTRLSPVALYLDEMYLGRRAAKPT